MGGPLRGERMDEVERALLRALGIGRAALERHLRFFAEHATAE